MGKSIMARPTDARKLASQYITQEGKDYHKFYNAWRRYDTFVTIFALAGLIIAVASYELDVLRGFTQGAVTDENEIGDAMDSDRYKAWYTTPNRWAIFGTSVAAIFCLVRRNQMKMKWQKNFFNRQTK